jgi:hypothetical protein
MILLYALACASVAPEDTAPVDVPCDDTGNTRLVVVKSMRFGRQVDGVSPGFDLDNHVSDENDAEGCFQEDLVDPAGVEGIDNAFSTFIPVLEATEGAALEGLLQDAIDSGTVLVLLELEDVDDPVNDDCVNLEVLQGLGTPRMGTDGTLLSGQTFDVDTSVPSSRADGLVLQDGTVVARGLELQLPIQIFDVSFTLNLHDVAFSITLDPLGGATGHLGGGITVQQIIDVIEPRTDIAIRELAIDMLRNYADLNPGTDGVCPDLSAVLEFEATSAFVFPDPPPDTGAAAGDTGG